MLGILWDARPIFRRAKDLEVRNEKLHGDQGTVRRGNSGKGQTPGEGGETTKLYNIL